MPTPPPIFQPPGFQPDHQALSTAAVLAEQEQGWVIGSNSGKLLRLQTEKHMITIANTGGGKGTSVAITNLLTHSGSAFSVEIGGATYNATHLVRRFALGQDVHVIDPYGAVSAESSSINLLDTLDPDSPRFFNEVKLFAGSMLKNERGTSAQDRYWEDVPKQTLMAFLLYVRTSTNVPEGSRHLPYLASQIALYGGDGWQTLMHDFQGYTGKGAELVRSTGNYFGKERNENTDGIISSIQSALTFAYDPEVARISRESTVQLTDLRNKKSTMYVVLPEAEDYSGLSTWLRLLVERSFAACPNRGDGGHSYAHDDRVLFMLDEFTQLGRLDAVDNGMQTARQKGVTIWAMFQDIGRLQNVYGKEVASSMLGSAGVTQVFDVGDDITKEYVSNRLGNHILYIPQIQTGESRSSTAQTSFQRSKTDGTNSAEADTTSDGHSLGNAYYRVRKGDRYKGNDIYEVDQYIFGKVERDQQGRPIRNETWVPIREGESVKVDYKNPKFLRHEPYKRKPVGEDATYSYFRRIEDPDWKGSHDSNLNGYPEMNEKRETVSLNSNSAHQETKGFSHQKTTGGGNSRSRTKGTSHTESHAPQIVPRYTPAQVEVFLGTGYNQILFIRAAVNGKEREVCHATHERAPFFLNPELKALAEGQWNFKPAPDFVPLDLQAPPPGLDFSSISNRTGDSLSPAPDFSAPVIPAARFTPVDPLARALEQAADQGTRDALFQTWSTYQMGNPPRDLAEMQRDHARLTGMVFPAIERAAFEITRETEASVQSVSKAWKQLTARTEHCQTYATFHQQQLQAADALRLQGEQLKAHRRALEMAEQTAARAAESYADYQEYLGRLVSPGQSSLAQACLAQSPAPTPPQPVALAAPAPLVPALPLPEIPSPEVKLTALAPVPAPPSSTPAPVVAVSPLSPGDLLAEARASVELDSSSMRRRMSLTQIDAELATASPATRLKLLQGKTKLLVGVVKTTLEGLIQVRQEQTAFASWEKSELSRVGAGHQRLDEVARVLTVAAPHLAGQGEALEVYWAGQDLARLELQAHAEFWQHRHAVAFNQLAASPRWAPVAALAKAAQKPRRSPDNAAIEAHLARASGRPRPGAASRVFGEIMLDKNNHPEARSTEMSHNRIQNINREGKAPTAEEIATLETGLGHKLPPAYIDLLSDLNATIPVYNSFPIKKDETETIEWFHPFRELKDFYQSYADEHEAFDDFPAPTVRGSSDISGFLPIAKTHGAHLCLDIADKRGTFGAVYCWQVSYDDMVNQFVKVADTLPQFMQSVQNTEISEEEYAKCEFGRSAGDPVDVILARVRAKRAKQGLK